MVFGVGRFVFGVKEVLKLISVRSNISSCGKIDASPHISAKRPHFLFVSDATRMF